MSGTDWLPGLLVLGVGLVVGLVLAFRARGSAAPAVSLDDDLAVRNLTARRESLFGQLRELDETGSKKTPEQLARQRYALELEAAGVLRDLDLAEKRASSAPVGVSVNTTQPVGSSSSFLKGYLAGAASVAFLALIGYLVMDSAADRMAGGSVTGNNQPGMAAEAAVAGEPDPELEQIQALVKAHPDDINAKLDLAQALIYREKLVEAFQVVQEVSAKEPENARALTYEAVVRMAMGQTDQAMQMLDKAVERDPQNAEAWVRRGLAGFQLSRWKVAVESWEKALELRPDGKDAIGPVLEQARARLAAGDAPEAAPAAAPAAVPAAVPAGEGVKITLELDPALQGKVEAGKTLFVVARAQGVTRGPPVAVKRLVVGTFPLEVTLTSADAMMGQPMPASATIEARVDSDGNAMTRDPADPVATGDASLGGAVKLVLRTP